jgi:predicted nucleotidyltransferase
MAKTIRISDKQHERIRASQKQEERDMDTIERMMGAASSGIDYEKIRKIVRDEIENARA